MNHATILMTNIGAILLLLILASTVILQAAQSRQEKQRIRRLQEKVLAVLDEEEIVFDKILATTQATPGMLPQLTLLNDKQPQTPEKYRIVKLMTSKGMGCDEIAALLHISSEEARQLATLSRLAKGSPASLA